MGSWNLKGLGFQYQVTYDITAVANLVLDPPVPTGNSLTVSGSGPADASYALLESTDISAPRTSWGRRIPWELLTRAAVSRTVFQRVAARSFTS